MSNQRQDVTYAELLWHGLNDCAALDKSLAVGTVTAWLEYHGAGCPDVPLMQEKVRSDALFWASVASPAELESYVVAGISAMDASLLTTRQIKRLAATAWQKMSDEDRQAFKRWIGD